MYSGSVSSISGSDTGVFQFLSTCIDPGEGTDVAWHVGLRGGIVHFGVDDVQPFTEKLRLAEKHEDASGSEPVPIPFDALEEHHLHLAGTVGNDDAQTFDCVESQDFDTVLVGRAVVNLHPGLVALYEDGTAGAVKCGADYPSHHLDVRHVGSDLRDALDAAPVYVPERIQVDEVAERGDPELILEQHRPFRPHPRQVLYVRSQLCHPLAQIYTFIPNSPPPFSYSLSSFLALLSFSN